MAVSPEELLLFDKDPVNTISSSGLVIHDDVLDDVLIVTVLATSLPLDVISLL